MDVDLDFIVNPVFASGQVYSSRMSQLLLNMSFYNKGTMLFINELFWTTCRELPGTRAKLDGGSVISVKVPAGIRTFGEVFQHYLSKWNAIVFALYRNNDHSHCGSTTPCPKTPFRHIISCPLPECVLCPLDDLYCLFETQVFK